MNKINGVRVVRGKNYQNPFKGVFMNKKIIFAITGLVLVLALSFITGCAMDVADPIKVVPLVEPYITQQPASVSYSTSSIPSPIPSLTVEVGEWEGKDGTLSYQWYTFANVAAYLNNSATEITGATEPEFALPGSLNTAAGAKNYFYVVITNTNNSATDRKEASVQSAVAVIAFNNSSLSVPQITKQPANAQSRFGRAVNPLSVRVEVAAPAAGDISYQWYQVILDADGEFNADANGFPIGEEIEDADESEFTPNPGQMIVGKNYFYVEVTYTEGSNSITEKSIPAIIDVLPAFRAIAPLITAQPKASLYFGEETVEALVIEAESQDFGNLTYQWYSNATGSNKSGTLIASAVNNSYTPSLSEGQSIFYFVVVTNNNDNVINETTASLTSRAVNVRRAVAASGIAENSTITIWNPTSSTSRYNYIRGYGGMDTAWANFPETYPEDTELMYDPDRLGYNILRVMIPPGNSNIDIGLSDVVNSHRPHYYNNVKIVNKYGGYVEAAPWSPPKEWKSNNSINGGGHLIKSYYKQYANYLKAYAQHMYNRGAPIYVISIQNEPNYTAGYDGCEWTPDEMRDFFKQVGFFTEGVKGYGGGKELPRVLAMNGESANTTDINHSAIDDPDAYQYIDMFARHVYGERRSSLWNSRPRVQRPWAGGNPTHIASDAQPKEMWMTEHNINSANATAYPNDSTWNYVWRFMNDVDLVMRLNNENAFVWWASKRFYSMVGDGQFGTPNGTVLPRGWGLSHYAKYTIDMTRIGFDMEGSNAAGTAIGSIDVDSAPVVNGATGDMDNVTARITAYVSADGNEISMVMWTPTQVNGNGGHDMGNIKINMPDGFDIGSVTAIRSYRESSASYKFHEPYDVPVSSDRRSAYISLPRSEMVSVKFTKQ